MTSLSDIEKAKKRFNLALSRLESLLSDHRVVRPNENEENFNEKINILESQYHRIKTDYDEVVDASKNVSLRLKGVIKQVNSLLSES